MTNLPNQILLKGIQPPELFTGTVDQDASSWLQDIEDMFDAAGIKKDKRRKMIPVFLGGDVKKWYSTRQYHPDYDLFTKELLETFNTSSQQLKLATKLMNHRQGLTGTVPCW
ncbi:unnamed protein product [Didymodactylos carnosus]|uniref:Uncharacterized protein n=1 Tax=Didymodactylos carnosus TaxID=1234261 RepID=A0A816E1P1_9BILA|nr:unnamed protein product [Didymodactylos carnosus]CAF4551012.1 unnamed protein product [Didymodactylos carnosus]